MDDDLFSSTTSMFDDSLSGISCGSDDLFSTSSSCSSGDDLMFDPINSWYEFNIFHVK